MPSSSELAAASGMPRPKPARAQASISSIGDLPANSKRQNSAPLTFTQASMPRSSSGSGWRASTKPYHCMPAGLSCTGVCLNSGSPDTGSTAGFTKLPTPPLAENSSLQWIGIKTSPARMASVMRARPAAEPHWLLSSTNSSSVMFLAAASMGLI